MRVSFDRTAAPAGAHYSFTSHAAHRLILWATLAATIQSCGGGGDIIPAFVSPANIAIGDINQDGLPDLIVSASTIHEAPPHPAFVAVLAQVAQTPGTFSQSVRFPAEFDPSGLAIADLEGSGRNDIVLGSQNTRPGTLVPNNFVVLLHDPARLGAFLGPVLIGIGAHVISDVAVGDIDGDGKPDVVTVATPGSAGSSIQVFMQSATQPGTFSLSQSITTATGNVSIALADFDGDGRLDIAVTASTDNGSGTVRVFLQDATHPGTFLPPTEYTVGLQPAAIAAGDLNGDGKLDLAVANMGAPNGANPSVSVLLQDPVAAGHFLPATGYASATAPMAIKISDIDGDGKPDLVTANASGAPSNPGSIQIYLQGPTPRVVLSPSRFGSFSGAYALAVGDLNGDKAPDIAIVDGEGVAVLFQNAQARGQFQPAIHSGCDYRGACRRLLPTQSLRCCIDH
uniref:FG-GAP repeat domain-containing protein n=1 Tax=Cupriavidus yeoncheonensis TaxID=1462994 RepID=UPI003F495719